MVKIGILDIGLTSNGYKEDIEELISIVSAVERLGFSRYWLGEHFSPTSFLLNNEILLSLLCERTKKIKIGVAGVLLLLNSPYRVALNYKLLEALYPGRIDLGIARGITHPMYSKALLGHEPDKEAFSLPKYNEKLTELMNYLPYATKRAEPIQEMVIPPFETYPPVVWLLGQSQVSAELAIKYKTKFCLSLFHSPTITVSSLNSFKESFFKANQFYPEISIAIAGTCSKNPATLLEAAHHQRNFILYPTVLGSPQQCQEQLLKFQEHYGVDEIIFLDIAKNNKDKLQSYKLLSKVFNLKNYQSISKK